MLDAALKRLGHFHDELGCAIEHIEPVFRVSVSGVARDAVVRLLRAAGSRTAHVSASRGFACSLFASQDFADRHVWPQWPRDPSSEQRILDSSGVDDEPLVAMLPTLSPALRGYRSSFDGLTDRLGRELVLEADVKHGGALEFASEDFKRDREIVLEAVGAAAVDGSMSIEVH